MLQIQPHQEIQTSRFGSPLAQHDENRLTWAYTMGRNPFLHCLEMLHQIKVYACRQAIGLQHTVQAMHRGSSMNVSCRP